MTWAYHLHHKPNLKNHITNKWKPRITTKHVLQDNSHIYVLTKHNIHQNHKPYPKNHPYSKLTPTLKIHSTQYTK